MSSRRSYCSGAPVPITGETGQPLRRLVADARVQQPRREAAALDVAQHGARRAQRRDRRLAPEPRERERALRVDLADARGAARRALSGKARSPAAAAPG